MSTLLSPAVRQAVAGGSAIRKMFEQGLELKKKYGADNVFDFSLGNPDLAPPPAVKAALALPLDELPRLEHHERPTQEQESIIDLMYAMLRVISARTGIAAQVIATRDDLMEFISSRETSRLSTSWRYDVAGRNLEKLLAGEIGLTVKGNTIELL